ncbi:unnamed protein product [Candidula unifasciata]|uniref:Bee-milk protein n=1 Tax=Candidula unifasciata TaxID=100452 RepID=A0A8S3ZER8_9EUPU|nr:unnamed protein product [Candidula unifasciata]
MNRLSATSFCLLFVYSTAQRFGQAELVYEWDTVEFDWPSEAEKAEALRNGTYVPERNLVVGIKVHKDDVYVTIPRWFWTTGHPVTLAKIVTVNNETKLRPYPSWAFQKQADCKSFQFVMSMEIDPNTDRMYVIDTGRVGNILNLCPAKIYIFDLKSDTLLEMHELPDSVVNRTKNFLNDIVLDYINGSVRYAYMSDAYDSRLIIYDFETKSAFYLKDPSMDIERNASVITFNGEEYDYILSAINGIAISPDFNYVYYCAVSSYSLYQIPTSTLRNMSSAKDTGIRRVGTKVSQTAALAYGNNNLYYGALGLNAVYFWDLKQDMMKQKVGMDKVSLQTQTLLVRNDSAMQWPDTFAFDNKGWLWFTSDRLPLFWAKGLPNNTKEGEPFMRIWKVYVNETGIYSKLTNEQGKQTALGQCPVWAVLA